MTDQTETYAKAIEDVELNDLISLSPTGLDFHIGFVRVAAIRKPTAGEPLYLLRLVTSVSENWEHGVPPGTMLRAAVHGEVKPLS